MTSTRKEIEAFVVSHNRFLKEAVKNMDLILLMRNMHPLYRSDYAYRLLREKVITIDQAREFTKIPKNGKTY